MRHRIDRFKKLIKRNKNATIYISILLVYTLVMLGIFLNGSKEMYNCSSGSLSSLIDDTGNTTTTESGVEDITTSFEQDTK